MPACEDVILELSELRTLDVSEEKDNYTLEVLVPGAAKMVQFLKSPECLPHLTSLDISGTIFIDFIFFSFLLETYYVENISSFV